ncbi:MAG TPA: hypothetical protein DCM08_03365 [Microscillaceae bacterium]|nr:hypothetical protein [Microscillaceae bacterium]
MNIYNWFCLWFLLPFFAMAQSNSSQSCLSTTSFEQVFRYLQWKKQTSKKLSDDLRIPFKPNYEAEASRIPTGQRIRVYRHKKPYFQIDLQYNAALSLLPSAQANETEADALFCELIGIAQIQGLPTHYVYTYLDGSANLWKIAPNEVEYIPITPEQSSTGTYNGGTPFKKAISAAQFTDWEALFYEAEKSTEEHQPDKTKGSGTVAQWITEGVCSSSFILKMNAPNKQTLEAMLQTFR